jgi:hypothetical protein
VPAPLATRGTVQMNRRKTMDKMRKSSQGRWRLHLLQLCLAVTLSIAGAMIYLVLTNV